MIFSKSRPVKIVLVGTGGTGGYIVPQLYRLLYALDRPIRVILCDGDLVEEKNLGRQNFIEADLGKNKAMVLAERYSNAFGIETSYIPQYVEDEEMLEELLEPLQYPQNRYVTNRNGEAVQEVISEIVILIGAVDNNRSRQVFHNVFQRAKELIYIDSGNSKASGQVICGVRRSGKTFYLGDGWLSIRGNSGLYRAELRMERPPAIVIGYDPRYLLDAFDAFAKRGIKTARMSFTSPVGPTVLTADNGFTELILPVRLKPEEAAACIPPRKQAA